MPTTARRWNPSCRDLGPSKARVVRHSPTDIDAPHDCSGPKQIVGHGRNTRKRTTDQWCAFEQRGDRRSLRYFLALSPKMALRLPVSAGVIPIRRS